MNQFDVLSEQEKEFLLKAPAYISLLAANADGKLDWDERKAAIEETHIKTYNSDPLVTDYYIEAEKVFQKNIDQIDHQLPKGKEERQKAITIELEKLEGIYKKLGYDFSAAIHESLKSYTEHVLNSHWNIFASVIFPIHDMLKR